MTLLHCGTQPEQIVTAKSLQTLREDRRYSLNRPLSHEIWRDKLLHKGLAIILFHKHLLLTTEFFDVYFETTPTMRFEMIPTMAILK